MRGSDHKNVLFLLQSIELFAHLLVANALSVVRDVAGKQHRVRVAVCNLCKRRVNDCAGFKQALLIRAAAQIIRPAAVGKRFGKMVGIRNKNELGFLHIMPPVPQPAPRGVP